MLDFDTLWQFVIKRSVHFPVVQERNELKHIFDLIQGCESYLEVGTAEGNSLYVLAHALKPGAAITCVDLGEKHTTPHHNEIIRILSTEGYDVGMYHGNSTDHGTYPDKKPHDVVLIDGGHDYATVLSDCKMYGPLAKKYILLHDIKLPDVARAVREYMATNPGKYSEFVNSPTMGFGIIEVK